MLAAATTTAHAQDAMRTGIDIAPTASAVPPPLQEEPQLLQLEVFINERRMELVAAFMRRQDGRFTASSTELDEVGLVVPAALARQDLEVPLDALPGVTYRYDEASQSIHFTVAANAQKPTLISGAPSTSASGDPVRPPLGALVNYTLFASADEGPDGLKLDGVSGAFETRTFGRFGLIENSFIGRTGTTGNLLRLDSIYTYEYPIRLVTLQAGDLISGGFSWTRPVRLGGLQVRRTFGLRPDLITLPLPTLTGSAAAPSTLDLYVNEVRTLSATVPQGPYEVSQPPIIFGSGQARIVLRDALGREAISITPFYASPELLAPSLTDFSAELGFARRNYASLSNDYDGRPAGSASYRRGVTEHVTVQAHAEGTIGFASFGGGAVFTLGTFGLATVAVAGSQTSDQGGALVDVGFESRTSNYTVTLRTQRTTAGYEDLASWTAVVPPNLLGERRIFGQPREIDQAALSVPLRWSGSSFGVSYVQSRRADDERSRLANLSFTQEIGPLALFASAVKDFEVEGSAAVFIGLSVPLGGRITASGGATRSGGKTAGYVEASRQGAHRPGAFGWSVRASQGERREAQAVVRYSTPFARFEANGLYTEGESSATGLMEGALTLIGGGLHATHRLDDAFALVEVGAPGVVILRENRRVGTTNRSGKLLVPDLAAFVSNRIALDPAGLPVDAAVVATEATTTPFSRVASLVDLKVETSTRSALLTLIDPQKLPIEIGARVQIEGQDEEFAVGYDGQVYVENLGDENFVLVTTPDEATCRARFSYRAAPGEQVHVDSLVCSPEARQP